MEQHDEGIDIVKFFLGVMTLLTVFVAGFAVVNWTSARALEGEVSQQHADLLAMERLASQEGFLQLVSRERLYRDTEDITTREFGRFLEDTASEMNLGLRQFRSVGTGGAQRTGNYTEQSYQFTIEQQGLRVIVAYLWYIQARPGITIKELRIQEAPRRRDDPFLGWNATVVASIFRPREDAR